MHTFIVKKTDLQTPEAAQVPQLLNGMAAEWHGIDCLNWPDFPYRPKVAVRMAHNGEALFLHYRVEEQTVAAVAEGDNGRVWEDSCCEFFCQPANDDYYYNLECNCVGTVLLAAGKEREGRERAPQEVLAEIGRWSSLGRKPFAEKAAPHQWELCLTVPVRCFFKHDLSSLGGQAIRANFYKCGDRLQQPHFLSFYPISLPKPDFHRPDFFGLLTFE